MNSRRLLSILFASVLLSACAPLNSYRTAIPQMTSARSEPGSDSTYFECAVDDGTVSATRARCEDDKTATAAPDSQSAGSQAIQHRFYQTQDGVKGDYYLSFIEFDDQGWFANRRQMEALFALLKKLEKEDEETNGHTLIQVYAHGWKHNASACDNNVVCFSRLLERTDLGEKANEVFRAAELKDAKVRKVVGVYVGWRGLPFDTDLNNISFWTRKDTAARVGRGGVFELLTRLKDYRDIRQRGVAAVTAPEKTDTNKTQLVITGHSFGGLVIYSALSHALMERATKTSRADKSECDPDPAAQYDTAKSFGDFVLLVNPAFEGSLYEPLFNIATNRCYKEIQRPVMMIVTSRADSDTGALFPIGRALSTLFQHAKSVAQGDSIRKAIGHDERYRTHNLSSCSLDKKNTVQLVGATNAAQPATALTYNVCLSEPNKTGSAITVTYAYNKDGKDTAIPGVDYVAATTTVDILDGNNSAVIKVPVLYDPPSVGTKTVKKLSITLTGATHAFKVDPAVSTATIRKGKPEPCPCPYLTATADLDLEALIGKSIDVVIDNALEKKDTYGKGISLTSVASPKYASNYPYLVVNTDAGMMADHNAIYNDRFVLFAQRFFLEHIRLKKPMSLPGESGNCTPIPNCIEGGLVPCQQSCQLANGDSCSVPPQPESK